MPHPLRTLAQRLLPSRAAEAARRAGPLAALSRVDLSLARAWVRHAGAIEAAMGPEVEEAWTALVLRGVAADPAVGRAFVYGLPDRLAALAPADRGRLLSVLGFVLSQAPSAAPLVLRTVPGLLPQLDDEALSLHLARGLQHFARSPRRAESFLRLESQEGQAAAAALSRGVPLSAVRRTLTGYARAHCGQDVQVLAGAGPAWTDGRHIHVPAQVDVFGDRRDFLVYRVLVARGAGFIEFGTLDLDLAPLGGVWPEARPGELEVERLVRAFPNPSIARDLFTIVESARVEAQVRAAYPGVARDMDALGGAWRAPRPDARDLAPAELAIEALYAAATGRPAPALPDPRTAAAAAGAVAALGGVLVPGARVADTVVAVQAAYPAIDGLLRRGEPEGPRRDETAAGAAGAGGGPRTPEQPGRPGAAMPPRPGPGAAPGDAGYRPLEADPFDTALRPEAAGPELRQVEDDARRLQQALAARGEPRTLAEARAAARREGYAEMAAQLDRQDAPRGPLREAASDPAPPAPPRAPSTSAQGPLTADAHATGVVVLHPEWDATIGDLKPRWVRVTEYRVEPGSGEWSERVRARHAGTITRLRRGFQALRPDALRPVRGVLDGEEIDLDRAIAARVERRAGGSPGERVYQRRQREERDVAVAFLVDLSSSTNEVVNASNDRILDVEKEALLLIGEAVDAIGDRSAIWGFSGYGRDQVAFYVVKEMDEPWDDAALARLGRLSWKMENRDGAAIRHAAQRLARVPARTRLLVLLSDGRPLDCGCDQYADRYAQEDTRQALQDARAHGVHPFCITVDPTGPAYLQEMYGEGAYTVVDRAERLPERLPALYRRLTR